MIYLTASNSAGLKKQQPSRAGICKAGEFTDAETRKSKQVLDDQPVTLPTGKRLHIIAIEHGP